MHLINIIIIIIITIINNNTEHSDAIHRAARWNDTDVSMKQTLHLQG